MAIKIGILNDLSDGPPSPADTAMWLQLIIDDYIAEGRINDKVELVNAWGLGLPTGSAAAVENAFRTLVKEEVQLIVGPAIGDNALITTPLAEHYKIPTINWAGSEKARSNYMFQLQVGSHEDESVLLVRYLVSLGVRRVGLVIDNSPIGEGHLKHFLTEAAIRGLKVSSIVTVDPQADSFSNETDVLLAADANAIVYLGLGLSAPAVAEAVRVNKYSGYCAMNSAGIRGYLADYAKAVDGWVYVDLFSDKNQTLQAFYKRVGDKARNKLAAAKGFDLGRLVAEAIARAAEPSCEAMRQALEEIKWLPAAQGYDGTLLCFGNYDRGALHGKYLVLRQWRDQQSLEIDWQSAWLA